MLRKLANLGRLNQCVDVVKISNSNKLIHLHFGRAIDLLLKVCFKNNSRFLFEVFFREKKGEKELIFMKG